MTLIYILRYFSMHQMTLNVWFQEVVKILNETMLIRMVFLSSCSFKN